MARDLYIQFYRPIYALHTLFDRPAPLFYIQHTAIHYRPPPGCCSRLLLEFEAAASRAPALPPAPVSISASHRSRSNGCPSGPVPLRPRRRLPQLPPPPAPPLLLLPPPPPPPLRERPHDRDEEAAEDEREPPWLLREDLEALRLRRRRCCCCEDAPPVPPTPLPAPPAAAEWGKKGCKGPVGVAAAVVAATASGGGGGGTGGSRRSTSSPSSMVSSSVSWLWVRSSPCESESSRMVSPEACGHAWKRVENGRN